MLDYKDIITKHLGLGTSGRQIAKDLGVSKSGVNEVLVAFKRCESLSFPLPEGITNYGIAAQIYGNPPPRLVGIPASPARTTGKSTSSSAPART